MKLLASLLLLGLSLRTPAAQDATVRMEGALGEGKDLTLHLRVENERVDAGFGTGLNARSHTLDTSGLRRENHRLRGEVRVTIHPDPWVPADGKPFEVAFALDLAAEGRALTGTYTGIEVREDRAETGVQALVAAFAPPPSGQARGNLADAAADGSALRVGVRIPGALRKVFRLRGPNFRYALDMDLRLGLREGTALPVRMTLESVVPDYRRYTARVESSALGLEAGRLRGTVTATIDHGGQSAGRGADLPREEIHSFDLDLLIVGNEVGGTCRIRVGEVEAIEHVVGLARPEEAPAAGDSFAWLRLHHAIQDRHSIHLQLSLGHHHPIHGFAWVPSENHQPHTVDASGLRLTDEGRLAGPVRVTVVPDVYRGGEPFTVLSELDVAIDSPDLRGTFTGEDRGVATQGTVTGELRAKREPAARSLVDLSGCVLGLGYSLVTDRQPHQTGTPDNHAEVRLDIKDGKVTLARLIRPRTGAELTAEFEPVILALEGDRLTGTVVFRLQDEIARQGRYRFDLNAIIQGDRLNGYWRADLDGTPILTRSSKLGGRLLTTGVDEGAE